MVERRVLSAELPTHHCFMKIRTSKRQSGILVLQDMVKNYADIENSVALARKTSHHYYYTVKCHFVTVLVFQIILLPRKKQSIIAAERKKNPKTVQSQKVNIHTDTAK